MDGKTWRAAMIVAVVTAAAWSVRAQSGAPVITSPTVADYGWVASNPDINPAFYYQIIATNSPTSFGASGSGLPPAGSVDTQRGLVSGLATVPGIYHVTVSATNAAGTGMADVTLRIHTAPEGASLSPGVYHVGDTISAQVFFNGTVVVTGQPVLQEGVPFYYGSGSGTSQLVFTHTVAASDPAGRIAPYPTWNLDQGAITDANGLTATSSIPTPRGGVVDTIIDTTPLPSGGSNPGRLSNLSVLAATGPGSQVLTLGFVMGGGKSGATQSLLLRGVGPGLAPFNAPGYVPDPTLTLFNGQTAIAFNDNWAGLPAVRAANTACGAFPLSDGSLDAALLASLTTGAHTIQISAATTGNALAEIYDTSAAAYNADAPHLVNLSCLSQFGAGGALTCGFVIAGTTSHRMLIRVAGPALAGFGVANVMIDPMLRIYESASYGAIPRGQSVRWGGATSLTSAFQAVGAFPFSNPGSADDAIIITLAPGNYSAVVNSASGSGGTVLVEVYEMP